MPARSSIEHFWSRVDVRGDDECWEWQGYRMPKGYGQIGFQGKLWLTHRLALSTVIEIPDDMHVMHSCDNPACCNPAHLSVGTNADNMRDRDQKGRVARVKGEKHNRAKITESEVLFIRRSDMTHATLAKIFNIGVSTVGHIKTRRTWKHLP